MDGFLLVLLILKKKSRISAVLKCSIRGKCRKHRWKSKEAAGQRSTRQQVTIRPQWCSYSKYLFF